MIIDTATNSASSAFHHDAAPSHAAAPVPAITGAKALGSVRGRAPSTHWVKLATGVSLACVPAEPAWQTERMDDQLSKAEIRKDAVQEIVGSGASTVGEVTSIITSAVKDVANAIGGLATDVFEIRDGARRASRRLEGERDEQ